MSADVDISQLAIVRDPEPAPRAKRRRHLVSRYLVPGILILGFLALVAWAARDVLLPAQQVWVVPVLASQSAVQSEGTPLFQAAGWVEPRPTPVRVPALAPGVVEKLLVVEDQPVKAGEPVAELVRADAQLSRDGARAQLDLRAAEQAEAEAIVVAAQAVYDAKQAATGVVAARAIQVAKGELDAAKSRVDAARARVEQARVTLAEAELRLERMTVRAPIDGRVYQLVAYPGTTLVGGMGPLPNADGSTVVTLYRPDMLQVRCDVRFEDIPKVSLGQSVLINNPALAEPIIGTVLYVSSEANIQKNTLEVKVALDKPVAVFKPEMLIDATYLAPAIADVAAEPSETMRLFVPQSLVLSGDGGSFVWVADQSAGVARRTAVTLGGSIAGGFVEVMGGIDASSRIIARGFEWLQDGRRIAVVSEDGGMSRGAARPMQRLPHGE